MATNVLRRALCQDRRWVVVLPAAVKGEVRAFPKGLEKYPESSVKMKDAGQNASFYPPSLFSVI